MNDYRVVVQRLAFNDLDSAFRYVSRFAPRTAAAWLGRFEEALQSLCKNPQRCPLAREGRKTNRELRELLFGKKQRVFRAIFIIQADTVRILRICRAARRSLSQKEIDEALDQED